MAPANPYLQHVLTAIMRRGYIRVAAADQIAGLLLDNPGLHPHAIARQFRKSGRLLDRTELKAAGLRGNAIMSHEAMAALTGKGEASPIVALDGVFLDASFNFLRQRGVEAARAAGYDTFKIDAVAPGCPGCRRLHGESVSGAYLPKLPPEDCARGGCMAMLVLHVDYYAGLK